MHVCTLTDARAAQALPYLSDQAGEARFDTLTRLTSTGLSFGPATVTPPEGKPLTLAADDYAAPGVSLWLDYAALQATLEQPFHRLRLFWLGDHALGFDFGDRFVIVGPSGISAEFKGDQIRPAAWLLSLANRPGAVVKETDPLNWTVTISPSLLAIYRRPAPPREDVDGALFMRLSSASETRSFVALDDRKEMR